MEGPIGLWKEGGMIMRKRLVSLATGLALFSILGIVILNGPVAAAPGDAGSNYFAYLIGSNEVPPTASMSDGMATFHVNYDGTLSYTVTAYNVPNVVMGHIHIGAPGTTGPVVLPLLPVGKPANGATTISLTGTATAADLVGPLKGQPLSALISQLASNAYINIHTSDGTKTIGPGNYPDGEIRGNIISSDAIRLNVQPGSPVNVTLPTGVVPFTSAGPAQISVPQIPIVVSSANNPSGGSSSVNVPGNQTNAQSGNAQTAAGGSTMGAASGAPTTGGSGASNTQPGNTPGFSGTGTSTGSSSGSTNLGAGGASGGIPTGNSGSIPTGGGSGSGTVSTPVYP